MATNQYEQAAIEALRSYHSVAASEFPENMQLSFDQFLAYIKTKPDFLLNFGKSVVGAAGLSGVGMSGIFDSMESLARQTQGRVSQFPDGYPRLTEFYDALMGRALQWDVKVIAAVGKQAAIEGANNVATVAGIALGGYGLILAISAGVGLYVVISSWKRR